MPADPNPLTVHVLDTATGRPAAGLAFALFRIEGAERVKLGDWRTDLDGRAGETMVSADAFAAGIYEITFDVAGWRAPDTSGFYDVIPIRFVVSDPAAHHHIPLLLSPFGYTTYRGS